MAFKKKINSKAQDDKNSGFGANASSYGGRFVTKSGNANVRKTGIGFFEGISWYHTMLTIPRWKFFFIISVSYTHLDVYKRQLLLRKFQSSSFLQPAVKMLIISPRCTVKNGE